MVNVRFGSLADSFGIYRLCPLSGAKQTLWHTLNHAHKHSATGTTLDSVTKYSFRRYPQVQIALSSEVG
jgi:hypothetical protein